MNQQHPILTCPVHGWLVCWNIPEYSNDTTDGDSGLQLFRVRYT